MESRMHVDKRLRSNREKLDGKLRNFHKVILEKKSKLNVYLDRYEIYPSAMLNTSCQPHIPPPLTSHNS